MNITSGDESAQRATSDVHFLPLVTYFCNREPLRGGGLIIHNFTTFEQNQYITEKNAFAAKKKNEKKKRSNCNNFWQVGYFPGNCTLLLNIPSRTREKCRKMPTLAEKSEDRIKDLVSGGGLKSGTLLRRQRCSELI